MRAVIHIQRRGNPRKVALDSLYPSVVLPVGSMKSVSWRTCCCIATVRVWSVSASIVVSVTPVNNQPGISCMNSPAPSTLPEAPATVATLPLTVMCSGVL